MGHIPQEIALDNTLMHETVNKPVTISLSCWLLIKNYGCLSPPLPRLNTSDSGGLAIDDLEAALIINLELVQEAAHWGATHPRKTHISRDQQLLNTKPQYALGEKLYNHLKSENCCTWTSCWSCWTQGCVWIQTECLWLERGLNSSSLNDKSGKAILV